jgi:hypothetical protein
MTVRTDFQIALKANIVISLPDRYDNSGPWNCSVVKLERDRLWVQLPNLVKPNEYPTTGDQIQAITARHEIAYRATTTVLAVEERRHFRPLLALPTKIAWDPFNKRSDPRYPCDLAVMCNALRDGSTDEASRIPGRLLDFSASGCQAFLRKEVEVGSGVLLTFCPPNRSEDVNVAGIVLRHGPEEAGGSSLRHGIFIVKFLGESERAIRNWLACEARTHRTAAASVRVEPH